LKASGGNEVRELVRALERQDSRAERLTQRQDRRERKKRGEPPPRLSGKTRGRGTRKG
jgi:hypothetical protein